ncbi:flagellar motor switch protein FliM [Dermatobacter hominis]|uniref:flagellar motor switch protein FliM n=1 Tax=Dermatobacter hominis TaxID=2884263 RepID=UPI001D115065|nr:FliM/FliN family flagellar motor switch protein [Dermatobacter hominis]UDY37192.1 FliM/FliN family flagellar motor switch protein [Dermatobacter hominis]
MGEAPARTAALQAFDFRRPNKLNRDHLRTLQILHETFAAQFATLLSSNLRTVCTMAVDGAEELSYEEYVRELPVPTHLTVLALDPLPGVGVLQFSIEGSLTVCELMLGGRGRKQTLDRPLTEIESALMRTVVERAMGELAYALGPVASLRPRVVGAESNPQFAQLASASDMVVVLRLRLRIADVLETDVSLAYLYTTLRPLLGEMSPHSVATPTDGDEAMAIRQRLSARVADVPVDVSVRFRPTTMRSQDVLGLEPGDLIPLGHPVDRDLTAEVDGVELFHVQASRRGHRLAALVTETTRPEQR